MTPSTYLTHKSVKPYIGTQTPESHVMKVGANIRIDIFSTMAALKCKLISIQSIQLSVESLSHAEMKLILTSVSVF